MTTRDAAMPENPAPCSVVVNHFRSLTSQARRADFRLITRRWEVQILSAQPRYEPPIASCGRRFSALWACRRPWPIAAGGALRLVLDPERFDLAALNKRLATLSRRRAHGKRWRRFSQTMSGR